MRRMLRVLGWAGTALSALLFAATAILWVRSAGYWESWVFDAGACTTIYTEHGDPGREEGRRYWGFAAGEGRFWVGWGTAPVRSWLAYQRVTSPVTAEEAERQFRAAHEPVSQPWHGGTLRRWHFLGVGYISARSDVTQEQFRLAVPFWMLAVFFGVWPTLFVARRLLRRKRYAKGLCQKCGYDLRATPQRCPECGSPTKAE